MIRYVLSPALKLRWMLLGFLTVAVYSVGAADPQYLTVHKKSFGPEDLLWATAYPASITQAGIDEILDLTGGSKGTPDRRLGFSYTLGYLHGSIQTTVEALNRVLQLSEINELPVIIQLDGVSWWQDRPDLWNWWDPNQPGYDPNNVNHVEWFDWGSSNAVKIGWRNWGSQIRVVPHPNLASPAVLNAQKEQLDVLVPIIASWYAGLPADKKYLLGGVGIDSEITTYVNAYYYENGNSYLDQDPANDPTGNAPASVPMGYAAATTLGIQSTGAISEAAQTTIVSNYFEEITATILSHGIPAQKVVLHGFDSWFFSGAGAVTDSVFSQGVIPAWSVYFRQPDSFDHLLDRLGGRPWGAIEFQPWNVTKSLLGSYLEYRNCRYLNVLNWEQVRNDPVGVAAIGSMLSDGRLSGDLAFGEVQEGRMVARTLTIQNNGSSPMVVSQINYPPGVSGSWPSGTVPAGGSKAVAVVFSPLTGEGCDGNITVVSDLPGSPHVRSCSGVGVPAPRGLQPLVAYDFNASPTPSLVDPGWVAPEIVATDITESGDPDGGGSSPELTNFSGASLNIKRNALDSNTTNFSDYATFTLHAPNPNELIELDHMELTFNQFADDFSLTLFVDSGSGFSPVASLGSSDNSLLGNSTRQLILDSVPAADSLVFRIEFAHAHPISALNTTLQLANIEVNGRIMDLMRPTQRLLAYEFKNMPTSNRADPDFVDASIGSATDITEFGDPDGKGGTPTLNNFWGDSLYIKQLSLDSNPNNFSDYLTFSVASRNVGEQIEADHLKIGFGQFADQFSLKVFVDSGEGFYPIASLGGADNSGLAQTIQSLDMQSVAASDVLDFRIELAHSRPYGGANWTLELKSIELDGGIVSGTIPDVEMGDVGFELLPGGESFVLTWGSTNGATYAVKTTTNLLEDVWTDLVTNLIGNGGTLSVTNEIQNAQQFYRILLHP